MNRLGVGELIPSRAWLPQSVPRRDPAISRSSGVTIVPGARPVSFFARLTASIWYRQDENPAEKYVLIDKETCIGCVLCARYCPWDSIDMVERAAFEERAELVFM